MNGGPSAQVNDANFQLPPGHVFKVMWEINIQGDSSPADWDDGALLQPARAPRRAEGESLRGRGRARYWLASLTDEAYERRYGHANPS